MDSTSSSSSPDPETRRRHVFQLPKTYKFLEVLGEGGYGTVVKCMRLDTGEVVAIKFSRHNYNVSQEVSMMKRLMHHKLDNFNIVKYSGQMFVNSRSGLMFEVLDISLQDYLLELEGPMRLEDIRTVIQQMATAFDALKKIGVIHCDVKIDNIMMVDQQRQPFRVKLIDFGLAILRSQAKPGKIHQTPMYWSPEIILGLPYSEAIDIWSLGCVMAIMIFGFMLFPATLEYDSLRFFIDVLGPPPQHLLKAARKTKVFFKKRDSEQWMLKTFLEYWGSYNCSSDGRYYTFHSLDEVKTMRLEEDNVNEADERRECIELLKAMLQWDEKDRITPSGILNHPFITKSYLNSSSQPSSCNEPEPSTSEPQTRTSDRMWTTHLEYSTSETLPGVVMVQPADPRNRVLLEETPDEDTNVSTSETLLPGVITGRPAEPMNRVLLIETFSEDTTVSTETLLPGAVMDLPADPINVHSIHPDSTKLPPITSDDSYHKKKRKKKNCLKRFFSWMKRKFSSCCSVDDVQEFRPQ